MRVGDYLKEHKGVFDGMLRHGISPNYVYYIDEWEAFEAAVSGGVRMGDAVTASAERLHLSERQWYNIVRRMREDL